VLDRPRPSFSGGPDSKPDEVDVRERVRRLIEVGFLSRFGSGRLVAGICRVAHDCTVCGAGIQIGEQEVEIVARGRTFVIYLHRPCLEIWTQEASDGDRPPRV
jgi:hypothetical protein